MMGGDNADFMSGYMTALENMNKEAVEFVRGIPVVKVFQQTIYSFKTFMQRLKNTKICQWICNLLSYPIDGI